MKTLTLLRHAKSDAGDIGLRDFDRPLNAKGRRAAIAVGRHLRDEGAVFDHIVASPAVRVMETLDAVEQGLGRRLAPRWDRRLYLATAGDLLDVIRALPDEAASALIVGHNPGLEELVLMLVPACADGLRDAVETKYPTASLARLAIAEGWGDAAAGRATLSRFVRPRDLDPSLGPDAE